MVMNSDKSDVKLERVVPRICGACISGKRQVGRYHCTRHELTFSNGDEFTSVCADWQKGMLLTPSSVRTERGEEPSWLSELRTALIDERVKARFYYDLCEESAKR